MTAAPTRDAAAWLVACDLDQTLIFSRRAFRLPEAVPEPALVVTEVYDGAAASFCTTTAAAAIRRLADRHVLVPVTTRTREQYGRIDLGVAPAFAVTANGGTLLVDGQPDPDWEATVRRRLSAAGEQLATAVRLAAEVADPSWVRLTRVADGLFVYLVAHERRLIPDLADLERRLAGAGWALSVQGRKVYLVPAALTKQAALAEVAERTGSEAIAAAGDSLLDAGMLAAADVAVRPAHGELHDAGWHRPHLRVTSACGLLGGEEVLDLLLHTTGAPVAGVTPAAG